MRQIDIPVAPYINSTGYVDDVSAERREESHHLLRTYAEKLSKNKVKTKKTVHVLSCVKESV